MTEKTDKPEVKLTIEEEVKERLTALEKERDSFVAQANQQIAAYNGAIGELRRLIEKKE